MSTFIHVCILIQLALLLASCEGKPAVRLGFVGPLTGQISDLGTSGRNGAILAVEQLNARGGINGRKVELLIKDDRNDPAAAETADRELIKEKVAAIIGHMTSGPIPKVIPLINDSKTLMLSPTASTSELAGKDDYFLRVYPTNQHMASVLANHVRSGRGIGSIAVIYDTSNLSYTETFYRNFRETFEKQGGRIGTILSYNRNEQKGFGPLAKTLLSQSPDGILIIASTLDTANLAQQIKKNGGRTPLFATEWSSSDDLITHGGNAVEGMEFLKTFDHTSQSPSYVEFKESYKSRFGTTPTFAAANSYECVQVLAEALSRRKASGGLKETILAKESFRGLQGDIRIDRFGDAKRTTFLTTVRGGEFKRTDSGTAVHN